MLCLRTSGHAKILGQEYWDCRANRDCQEYCDNPEYREVWEYQDRWIYWNNTEYQNRQKYRAIKNIWTAEFIWIFSFLTGQNNCKIKEPYPILVINEIKVLNYMKLNLKAIFKIFFQCCGFHLINTFYFTFFNFWSKIPPSDDKYQLYLLTFFFNMLVTKCKEKSMLIFNYSL